jgi:hypothetical protein
LSDPVILSRTRQYGLGPQGISSFFSHHYCNNYCRPNWTAPANPVEYYRPTPGTTFVSRHVPTAMSKPSRTYLRG